MQGVSTRWRCARSLVTLENGARPLNGVAHPDTRWLRVRPELEVLRTIVVPDTVSMVNEHYVGLAGGRVCREGSDAIRCVRYDFHVVTLRTLKYFLQL